MIYKNINSLNTYRKSIRSQIKLSVLFLFVILESCFIVLLDSTNFVSRFTQAFNEFSTIVLFETEIRCFKALVSALCLKSSQVILKHRKTIYVGTQQLMSYTVCFKLHVVRLKCEFNDEHCCKILRTENDQIKEFYIRLKLSSKNLQLFLMYNNNYFTFSFRICLQSSNWKTMLNSVMISSRAKSIEPQVPGTELARGPCDNFVIYFDI